LDVLKASPYRVGYLCTATLIPGEIVEWSSSVSYAPMHEWAVGVVLQRLFETSDAFFVVEAVAPFEADVEPALGLG
jgi:hypothetical protein